MLKEDELRQFGQSMYGMRKSAHMTQMQLAEAMDVDNRMISRYENGHAEPGAMYYDRLLEVCGQKAGDWCRFCRAKPVCRACAEEAMSLCREEFLDLDGGMISNELNESEAETEPDPVTDDAVKPPLIGMDGRTPDGAMPYELLKKQLEFLK